MDTENQEVNLASIAAIIAEPARSRMLCCLLDGHARTSTELGVVAGVGAPTASAHLQKMKERGLVHLTVQGRHRYYRLAGPEIAQVLEDLLVIASAAPFVPSTPMRLRSVRTCYDHLAGELGVKWHDHSFEMGWLVPNVDATDYSLSAAGQQALAQHGLDPNLPNRRRFAYPCMDWSERRPHLGGALGARFLDLCLTQGWLRPQLDGRAMTLTSKGRREFSSRFRVVLNESA
jgi:DNA-binding transcriptional ArsR family regulator